MTNSGPEPLIELQQQLLGMADTAASMVGDAVRALGEHDELLADSVIARDDEVDQADFEIEGECVRLVAARQSTGRELRLIASILKVIADVERVADYSLDIAKIALLLGRAREPCATNFQLMGELGQKMLREAVAAFAHGDVEAAGQVVEMDREMDRLYHSQVQSLVEAMEQNPQCVRTGVYLVLALRYLERIGDHVCNVAERVLYVAAGQPARLRGDREPEAEP